MKNSLEFSMLDNLDISCYIVRTAYIAVA